ncbi:hypothetical protein LAZ67_8000463 [Cordylochernes scorpioides]|uniref:CCHC-type domain-containing protein n=1 Tax=Cordylochernes scorpioides TaxID=51811 RepID=A0ABY6KQ97_9ARAC|nr:hypothetical protein LAZ67_8000463 [Cordylochernes scorpioides]
MEQKLKQRICIEFCVKLQISATDTFEMLNKAFPNNAPKRTTVFEWHSRFKAGRISIEDDPRQGRPTFQRTDENLEKDTGISKTTIGRIVTEDLRLKKTPAKFIPRFLTNEQKLCRLATCEDMLEITRTDPEWKDKIITGDETWVYGYDPETKRQSAEWRGQGEPRPKKSRILKSRNKVLLVAFLDNKGIVHHEYLPAGRLVIKEMYLSILRRLREAIRKKRPEKWTNGDWILHHDNARPHTAHLVTSFLAKNGTEILPQPPYSPDIAPNDFFLFPKLKAVLKGSHFDTREDIIEKSLLALKRILKEAYKNCFDNWEKRWRCPYRRLARWAQRIHEYEVTVCFKNCRKHKDADCLSRSPLPETSEGTVEEIPFLAMPIPESAAAIDLQRLDALPNLQPSAGRDGRSEGDHVDHDLHNGDPLLPMAAAIRHAHRHVRKVQAFLLRYLNTNWPDCLIKVDEETSNSTIEETLLETPAVSQLPGDKVVRVAHRSAPRNGTCTAFIEVDLKTFRALGNRGRIVVDGVILNFEESIRARVFFRCCGFGHNSAQCTRAPKCFHCGEGGHEGRSCPSVADQRTSKCANCCAKGLPDKHEARASSCPILKSRALKF